MVTIFLSTFWDFKHDLPRLPNIDNKLYYAKCNVIVYHNIDTYRYQRNQRPLSHWGKNHLKKSWYKQYQQNNKSINSKSVTVDKFVFIVFLPMMSQWFISSHFVESGCVFYLWPNEVLTQYCVFTKLKWDFSPNKNWLLWENVAQKSWSASWPDKMFPLKCESVMGDLITDSLKPIWMLSVITVQRHLRQRMI